MVFMINPKCKCCKDTLHHCKRCWDLYHNGRKHKDYIPPKYFGQSMVSDEIKEMWNKFDVGINPSIKADKNREYMEGEYH